VLAESQVLLGRQSVTEWRHFYLLRISALCMHVGLKALSLCCNGLYTHTQIHRLIYIYTGKGREREREKVSELEY